MAVADPGFPVGGRGPRREGRGLPRWLRFEMKKSGRPLTGSAPPRIGSANAWSLYSTAIESLKISLYIGDSFMD